VIVAMRWWRVVRRATSAPRGHRGGHAWELRVVPSAHAAARRARVGDDYAGAPYGVLLHPSEGRAAETDMCS